MGNLHISLLIWVCYLLIEIVCTFNFTSDFKFFYWYYIPLYVFPRKHWNRDFLGGLVVQESAFNM